MSSFSRLALHGSQAEVYNSPHRFKVVVAGRRWGKTQLARTDLLARAAKRPRSVMWYVAPTFNMARDVMWPELLDVVPRRWVHKINETRMSITLKTNTRINLKGADRPDTLRGVGLHHVVLDEFQDIDPDAWKKVLRPTLTTSRGSALFIGTPKSFNYLYELYMIGQRPELQLSNRWKSWQFRSIDSPFISQDEIDEARQEMDERSFRQEFEASFETMGGRVYWPFDRRVHVWEGCLFNPKLPIWVGQDFNRDPMSSVILQLQDNGEVWAVDEIVLFNSNTEEVVNELERRYWRYMSGISIFPDPAGSYSQHARGETDLDIFREKGFSKIYYRRKHPKIVDRVNCVNKMLKAADGTIKLRIHPRCQKLIESLEKTVWKEGCRELDKAMSVEHSTDALGYPIEFKFPMRPIVIAGLSL